MTSSDVGEPFPLIYSAFAPTLQPAKFVGASAMGVYRGTVLSHDLRLGYGNRQLGISTLIPDLDYFI